jgi:hypothetical protein
MKASPYGITYVTLITLIINLEGKCKLYLLRVMVVGVSLQVL